jgi:signal transduction histidine kinase
MLFGAYTGDRSVADWKKRFGYELLVALVLSALSFGIRYAVDPFLGDRQPFTPSFGAVAIAAWFGGWRSGAMTALLAYLLALYFFVSPRGTTALSLADLVGGASYWVIAGLIVYLAHRARLAIQQLQQANAQKDQFIAILAHEFRTPLNAAAVAAQVVAQQAPARSDSAAAAGILRRQIDHMKRLLRDLTTLAHDTDKRLTLQLATTSLQQVIDDAVRGNEAQIAAKRQEISVHAPAETIFAEVDSVRITQIISNLLNNASKYSAPGAAISLTMTPCSDYILISVKDDGPGIRPERISALFERHSPNDRIRADEGLGIGLWLSRRLAEMHGGTLTARNAAHGHGAEFQLSLPMPARQVAGTAFQPSATADTA